MHFHKLEEFLRSDDGAAFSKSCGLKPAVDADRLRQSVKFYAGDTNMIPDGELVEFGKLPYPNCAFEFRDLSRQISNRFITLARQTEDAGIILQTFEEAVHPDGWRGWMCAGFLAINKPDLSDVQIRLYAPKGMEPDLNLQRVFGRTIARQCNLMGRMLRILNLTNVTRRLVAPSEKLNAKRLSRGRQPIYSFYTLVAKVGGGAREILRSDHPGESKGLVRVHLRRGHIKRCRTGEFWWQPCVVGNPKRGVVMKDYALEVEP